MPNICSRAIRTDSGDPADIHLHSECHPGWGNRLTRWALDPEQEVQVLPPELTSVVGDLTGRGVWTLTPRDGGVHIRFDWRVIADRPLLRVLTPLLRPVFRWNHNWSIERAREGLESYARAKAA
jgi:hypothetical protein